MTTFRRILGVVIWVISAFLITSIITSNDNKTETIALTGLRVQELIIGHTDIKPDISVNSIENLIKITEADGVFRGIGLISYRPGKRGEGNIVLQVKKDGWWYRATQPVEIGFSAELKESRLEGNLLSFNRKAIFVFGKNIWAVTALLLIIILFALIGVLIFKWERD